MIEKDYGAYTLSPSPRKAAEEMVLIIENLQHVYEQETEALENTDIPAFVSLQQKKLNAARSYEFGIAQILDRKDEMTQVPDDMRRRLRAMQKDFSELVANNKTVLERMRRTTERLGETIRGAARDVIEQRTSTSYSAEGAMNKKMKGNMSVGISETA